MPIEILCCYARRDQKFLKELKDHLHPLKNPYQINIWTDMDISAGREWEEEIKKHLDTASIIILLISVDFIKSDYCYGIELQRAIERHERGEVRIVPILLRPVHWQETYLNKLQMLPTDALPVTKWSNQDDAFLNITRNIVKVLRELKEIDKTPQIELTNSFEKSHPMDMQIDSKTLDEDQRITYQNLLDKELRATYLKIPDQRLVLQLCYSIRQTCIDVILTFKNLTQNYPYQDIPDIRVLFFIVYPHHKCIALQCYVENNTYFVNCKHRFTLDPSKQEKLSLVAQAWNSQQIRDFSYMHEATDDKEEWLRESSNFGFDREKIEHSKSRIASAVAFPLYGCKLPYSGKLQHIVICIDSPRKAVFPKKIHSTLYELISNLVSDFNIRRLSPLECTAKDFANDTGGIINECNN